MRGLSTRNWIAVGLTIVSLALLVPGLRSDALTITASIPLLKKPLFEETQSIMRAARRLYDSKNYFVAGLVVFFSVVVPFIKVLLLGAIVAVKSPHDEVPDLSVHAIDQQVGDGRCVCGRRVHRLHGGQRVG